MNQYGSFAHWYDRMMHDVDYTAWAEYIDSFLKEAGAKTVLDCACGTGRITVLLASAGYIITGSDASEDMLMEARAGALKKGLKSLPFVCQNLQSLSVHHPVDAVICTCDGVNYLTDPDDVIGFLESASRVLRPGGLLLFDISSPYKFAKILADRTFTEVEDDYAYIWSNMFDPESMLCEMDLTFFVKEHGLYRRFSEQHLQRAYTEEELTKLLVRNGFYVRGVYDAFTRDPIRPDSERFQFAAIKESIT